VDDQDFGSPGRPVFFWVASVRLAGALSCKNKTTLLENRVRDQDIGSPGRPVSSGLQVSCELECCRARTRPSL
jgi:hypothetical protein